MPEAVTYGTFLNLIPQNISTYEQKHAIFRTQASTAHSFSYMVLVEKYVNL